MCIIISSSISIYILVLVLVLVFIWLLVFVLVFILAPHVGALSWLPLKLLLLLLLSVVVVVVAYRAGRGHRVDGHAERPLEQDPEAAPPAEHAHLRRRPSRIIIRTIIISIRWFRYLVLTSFLLIRY